MLNSTEIVASLIDVMTGTVPNLSYIVSKFFQCLANNTKFQLSLLRYLKKKVYYYLKFNKSNNLSLIGNSTKINIKNYQIS